MDGPKIDPAILRAFRSCGLIVLLYAILVFVGGFMGFTMKGSIPSLAIGSLFGLSIVLASVLILTYRKWGLYSAFALIFLLDAFFAYRYLTTHAFFPAGMMLILTSLTIVLLVFKLAKISKKPSEVQEKSSD